MNKLIYGNNVRFYHNDPWWLIKRNKVYHPKSMKKARNIEPKDLSNDIIILTYET